MKHGWEIKKLGEVVDVLDNLRKPITKRDRIEGEYPYYGATGILSYVHNYIFSEKLVLIGEDGAKWASGDNTSFIAEGKYWVNNHAHAIRPNRKIIIDEWIVYLLNFSDLTPFITGMTVPKLNQKKMRSIPIPLPPLPEQQRIVAILDEAFAAIAKAKANAEQNLKNAKELFESYLQGVFEKKGDGWEEKRIEEICKLINGRAYKKDELLSKGKYRVLRVGNFFTSDHWYYSDLELDEDKYCDKEDLLYAWSASFGPRIWKEEKVIYHYHIWKVIPDENLVTRDFLFTLFEWDKEKIKTAQGTGTTMIHVSKGSMENRIIPVPPIKTQQAIVRQLDALRAETQKLEAVYQKKVADLEELKKSILQKAFAGELRSPEGAEYTNDVATPIAKKKTITNPERA
jgi:type I restriction enzyme S subunit